jgi:hypothetical protein
MMSLDSFGLARLDLLKIDVEGMESEVLQGAQATIYRCRPAIFVETMKIGRETVVRALPPRYDINDCSNGVLALPE